MIAQSWPLTSTDNDYQTTVMRRQFQKPAWNWAGCDLVPTLALSRIYNFRIPHTLLSARLALMLAAVIAPASPAPLVIDFEGLADGTVLANQYPGVIFSNASILSSGISLNEFEFPPHSGINVASDDGGPMSINFSTPVATFSGYFTYSEPLTLTAYDASKGVLRTMASAFSNNLACLAGPPCSGDPGSSPDELITLSFTDGISSVTINGDPMGGSFVLDDAQYETESAAVPEPGSLVLLLSACLALIAFRKTNRT